MADATPESLKRRFFASYAIALFVLVAVSLAAHVYIEHTLSEEREAATMVNVSGAQRMLSQRTLALTQALSDDNGRTEVRVERLAVTLNRLQSAHADLRDYALTHPMSVKLSVEIRDRFTGPGGLDELVREFVILAEPAADRALSAGELAQLETLAFGPLFDGLDDAVSLFQRDAENGLETIAAAHMIQLILIILVLVAEALFIFWPLTRKLFGAMATEVKARQQAEQALRLEASMDASKQRFVSMIKADYLDPLERMSDNLFDMDAGDRASWLGLLAATKREIEVTRQRISSMVNFFEDWQSRFGSMEDEDDDSYEQPRDVVEEPRGKQEIH